MTIPTVESSFKINSNAGNVVSLTIVNVTSVNSDRRILVSGAVSSSTTTMTSVARSTETYTLEATASATDWKTTMWSSDSEPATTATDIVCTLTGAGRRAAASCIVMSDVDQTTPLGTAVTNTGDAGTSSSATITGGDLTVDTLGTQGTSDSGTTAPGTGQTLEVDNESSGDFSTRADNYMSYEAAETTMTWSWTTSANYGAISIPVNGVTGGTEYTQSASGALSFAGSPKKKTTTSKVGALLFVGNIVKKLNRLFAGLVSFAGLLAVIKKAFLSLAGGMDFVGSTWKSSHRPLYGGADFVGNMNKKITHIIQGILSFVGELRKKILLAIDGVLSFVGDLSKKTSKSVGGVIDFIGNLLYRIVFILSLAGSLGPSGYLARIINKQLSGVLSFSGLVYRFVKMLIDGAIDFSGDLVKKAGKQIEGALSFVGNLLYRIVFIISLNGLLLFDGSAASKAKKLLYGLISFDGGLRASAKKLLLGVIDFAGAIAKKSKKTLYGALGFVGSLIGGVPSLITPMILTLCKRSNILSLTKRIKSLTLYLRTNILDIEDKT